jgi:hypothetical protein
MCRALPGSDYYADSATPRLRQPASGLAGPPPTTRRLRGASHVHCDPFNRVGSRLYPCSASEEQWQHLLGHRARIVTCSKRPTVFKGTVVAASSPYPPGLGLLCESRGFCHRFAFALPFGHACTRAGVWQYRPAVTLSGLLPPLGARSHTTAAPSCTGPLHQPGAGIPAGTDRDASAHLLSHSASWRTEEVAGKDRFAVCSQEVAPGLRVAPRRRWQAGAAQDVADGTRRDSDTELCGARRRSAGSPSSGSRARTGRSTRGRPG